MNVYYNKYLILISSDGREKKFQSCQKRRFIHYSKNPPISKKRVIRRLMRECTKEMDFRIMIKRTTRKKGGTHLPDVIFEPAGNDSNTKSSNIII